MSRYCMSLILIKKNGIKKFILYLILKTELTLTQISLIYLHTFRRTLLYLSSIMAIIASNKI